MQKRKTEKITEIIMLQIFICYFIKHPWKLLYWKYILPSSLVCIDSAAVIGVTLRSWAPVSSYEAKGLFRPHQVAEPRREWHHEYFCFMASCIARELLVREMFIDYYYQSTTPPPQISQGQERCIQSLICKYTCALCNSKYHPCIDPLYKSVKQIKLC